MSFKISGAMYPRRVALHPFDNGNSVRVDCFTKSTFKTVAKVRITNSGGLEERPLQLSN